MDKNNSHNGCDCYEGQGRPFAINDIDEGTNDIHFLVAKDASEALSTYSEGTVVVPLDGRWCDYCPETYWSGGTKCPTCNYDYAEADDTRGVHSIIDSLISEAHRLQMNISPGERLDESSLYAGEVSRIAKLAELIEKTILAKKGI